MTTKPEAEKADPDAPKPGDELQQAHERIAATEMKLAETEDRLLRALAEQENVRRVAARERQDAVRFAAANLAADLLETVDNLERAIGSGPTDNDERFERLINGVLATQQGLLAALERHGITRLEPLGERFDPTRHHAAYERLDPNADDGTVIEVLQPGYLIRDRLLRPAMVGVANNAKAAIASD